MLLSYIDCFVTFMSFSKIGEEQSAEDAEDGPPELLVSRDRFAENIYCDRQRYNDMIIDNYFNTTAKNTLFVHTILV